MSDVRQKQLNDMKIETKKGEAYLTQGDRLERIEPRNGTSFVLEELYEVLSCETIEVLYLPDETIIIIDENGKFRVPSTSNHIATLVYNKQFGRVADHVVGAAIICNSNMLR